jgi:hypothetical protein
VATHLFGEGQNFFSKQLNDVAIDGLVGHAILLFLIFRGFWEKKIFQNGSEFGPKIGEMFRFLACDRQSGA